MFRFIDELDNPAQDLRTIFPRAQIGGVSGHFRELFLMAGLSVQKRLAAAVSPHRFVSPLLHSAMLGLYRRGKTFAAVCRLLAVRGSILAEVPSYPMSHSTRCNGYAEAAAPAARAHLPEVKKCGKKRIWLDPNEVSDIGMANSRFNVRKLIKDGLIIRKPVKIHSRARVRKTNSRNPRILRLLSSLKEGEVASQTRF